DYLAKMVEAIDAANPAVIAIDFDLRSPSPDGHPVEFPAYTDETKKFMDAVKAASHNRKIVLPKTVGYDDQHNYVSESDIYNGFDFDNDNVRVGYIALPPDIRQVPWLSLHIKNGDPLNSFSQAIARADNEEAMQNLPEKTPLPYGSYIRPEAFTVVSSSEVLSRAPKVFEKLAHKIVILGGNWHSQGYKRGTQIDAYDTPIESVPGAYIHANYVEALLDSRIYRPWAGWTLILIEVIQSLLIAIPFALKMPLLFKLLAVVVVCLALFAFSLLSLMVLGLFFDFFIPGILVLGHGIIEQIRE
ncbi:MAG TPA: CHASE2 domain-containing protein, partial [Blastocatellia bacterium]|nr:CHASE2 domain-containing protein [Blastocatellia bacterium]